MRDVTAGKRTYEVVESFSMGAVDVSVLWKFTFRPGVNTPSVEAAVGVKPCGRDQLRERLTGVAFNEVPYHVLEEVKDMTREDELVLQEELSHES
jgi:hypothetical protein